MFRFEHPSHLYALILILVLIGLLFLAHFLRKRTIQSLGNEATIQKLMPNFSIQNVLVKHGLLVLGLTFLIVAWANPQWGTKKEKVKRQSADVMIALDISTSMLAEDVPPSRMERAKRFCNDLIEEIKGDRIGLILFAGNAYLQMPMTTDYAAAKVFVNAANPNLASTQGTAIADALDLSIRAFDVDNRSNKALVLITDGENHEAAAEEMAAKARDAGMLLYTIGVGTASGGLIPITVNGRREQKRDYQGQPVTTKLNEPMLRDIAKIGDGFYANLQGGPVVLNELKTQIEKMQKKEFEQRSFSEYESYFQHFLFPGLLLILLEFLLTNKRIEWLRTTKKALT